MAWNAVQLAALEEALATGAARVTVEGRTIEYRSVDELRSLIAQARADVEATSKPSRALFPSFSRGWE